ncbi:MAG: hypothetical protein WBM32_18540 [Crocosphaera sp.]|jgi:hypothetical protein
MFKRFLAHQRCYFTLSLGYLLSGWLLATPLSVHAQPNSILTEQGDELKNVLIDSDIPINPIETAFDASTVPNDPLDSPFPVPWQWIIETQQEFRDQGVEGNRYYRSQALVSPDGKYAAYTRIQMVAASELYQSQVTSVVFLENLETGELQVIRADSPLAKYLLESYAHEDISGLISVLMPISWSAKGDRLLSRQLEGFFNTSDVTDYGVIWERESNETTTLTPVQNPHDHETAILLGWNDDNGEQVLFRSGSLGDEDWPLVAVTDEGDTLLATDADSVTYGQFVTRSWTGSQILQ